MILIMVLITLTMGQAKEDLDIMKEMMAEMKMEMNERLSLSEGKLAKVESELSITNEALMSRTDELEREVAILRALPFLHVCGTNGAYLYGNSGTVQYSSLLYSSTNTEGGGLDIITGVFTAPTGGSYTVSWDTQADLGHVENVRI